MDGIDYVTCQHTGNWGFTPNCSRETCSDPGFINNSTREPSSISPIKVNEKVRYTCISGFGIIFGNAVRTCSKDGNWTGNEPNCTLIDCKTPPNINNGTQIPGPTQYQSNIAYECDKNFKIKHINYTTCLITGNWSELPSCIATHCSPLPPVNLANTIFNGTKVGQNVTYDCFKMYNLTSGSAVRECKSDGFWSGSTPLCLKVNCTKITVTNGNSNWNFYESNHTIFWSCESGYYLTGGNKYMTCLDNGSWSGVIPKCERVNCGEPNNIADGVRTLSGTLYNDNATYTCFDGYELVNGSSAITCQQNTKWSDEAPKCEPGKCSNSSLKVDNAVYQGGFYYNETVTYNCNSGYEYESGNMLRTCIVIDKVLKWNGTSPKCKSKFRLICQ